MRLRAPLVLLAAVAAASFAAPPALAAPVASSTPTVQTAELTGFDATSVNSAGVVAGTVADPTDHFKRRPALWVGGRAVYLDNTDLYATQVNAINDLGQVAGAENGRPVLWQYGTKTTPDWWTPFFPANEVVFPVVNLSPTGAVLISGRAGVFVNGTFVEYPVNEVVRNGVPAPIGGLNCSIGSASAIYQVNAFDHVAVTCGQFVRDGHSTPGLWNGFGVVPITPPAGVYGNTRAVWINNRDEVVGNYETGPIPGIGLPGAQAPTRSFVWRGGVTTDLGTLGGDQTAVFDPYTAANFQPFGGAVVQSSINDAGQIVGQSKTADGTWHAFLYSDGHMTDLTPDSPSSDAAGINSLGWVIGTDNGHGVVWINGHEVDLGAGVQPIVISGHYVVGQVHSASGDMYYRYQITP